MTRRRRLSKLQPEEPALEVPAPEQVSALVREFAEPLLYADPQGPADLETIRTALQLAMICWNLPVYEASDARLYAQGARSFERILERVPRVVALRLRDLLELRRSKLVEFPFLVLVEVTGTRPRDASIVAEARLPGRRH